MNHVVLLYCYVIMVLYVITSRNTYGNAQVLLYILCVFMFMFMMFMCCVIWNSYSTIVPGGGSHDTASFSSL